MVFIAILVALRLAWAAFTNLPRARLIALGIDDLANVATNGYFRVTVSLRAAEARELGKPWGCRLCKWLDRYLEQGHCDKALANQRRKLL